MPPAITSNESHIFHWNTSSIHKFQQIYSNMKISFSLLVSALFPVRSVVGVGDCGCSSCTSSVLGRDADGYPVGNRIDWVMANMGQSEQDACNTGKIAVLFCTNFSYTIMSVVTCGLILCSDSKH